MKAKVSTVNYRLGRATFVREDGEIGWFEILDTTEVSPGEIVTGNFSELGGTSIRKLETGEIVDVFIQDFCSLELANQMVLYPTR